MNWKYAFDIALKIGTILSLVSLLSVLLTWFLSKKKESSIIDIIKGENVVHPESVVTILMQFKSDKERLKALSEILSHEKNISESILKKVKSKLDIGIFSLNNQRNIRKLSIILSTMFILLTLIALLAKFSIQQVKSSIVKGDKNIVKVDKKNEIQYVIPNTIYVPGNKSVNIKGFHIGQYEVTFDEYDFYCEKAGIKKAPSYDLPRELYPVFQVSYSDAKNYCKWLSIQTQKKYRLPTLREWEYVCSISNDFFSQISNNDDIKKTISDYVIYVENSNNHVSFVGDKSPAGIGHFLPAGKGIYDLFGNLWEWVDIIDVELKDKLPTGMHYIKGGSFNSGADDLKCNVLTKQGDNPTVDVGFRILLEEN